MSAHRYWKVIPSGGSSLVSLEFRSEIDGPALVPYAILGPWFYDFSAEDKQDVVEYVITGSSILFLEIQFSDDGVNWYIAYISGPLTSGTDVVFRIPDTDFIIPNNVAFVLSGGESNILEYNSIGGAISTKKILSQKVLTTTVSGINYINGHNNTLGSGILTYTAATGAATWQPFGGSVGSPIDLRRGGECTLTDSTGEQFLTLDVDWEILHTGDITDTGINVINAANETFDDISYLEGEAGDIEYRCYYLKNYHPNKVIYDVKLWLEQQPSSSTLSIGLDPQSINQYASNLVDEDTTPQGVVFVQPDSNVHVDVITVSGVLYSGDYFPFWIKRDVPIQADYTVADISSIGVEFGE